MPEFDLLGLPGIDEIPDALRVLMAVGLPGLLVLLRFDAERFNAAEYNDIDRWGRRPSLMRRLAWYAAGDRPASSSSSRSTPTRPTTCT